MPKYGHLISVLTVGMVRVKYLKMGNSPAEPFEEVSILATHQVIPLTSPSSASTSLPKWGPKISKWLSALSVR